VPVVQFRPGAYNRTSANAGVFDFSKGSILHPRMGFFGLLGTNWGQIRKNEYTSFRKTPVFKAKYIPGYFFSVHRYE